MLAEPCEPIIKQCALIEKNKFNNLNHFALLNILKFLPETEVVYLSSELKNKKFFKLNGTLDFPLKKIRVGEVCYQTNEIKNISHRPLKYFCENCRRYSCTLCVLDFQKESHGYISYYCWNNQTKIIKLEKCPKIDHSEVIKKLNERLKYYLNIEARLEKVFIEDL